MAKQCPFCSAQLSESARFCIHCMTSLDSKTTLDRPRSKSKRWLPILLCSVFLAVSIVSVGAVMLRTGTDTGADADTSQGADATPPAIQQDTPGNESDSTTDGNIPDGVSPDMIEYNYIEGDTEIYLDGSTIPIHIEEGCVLVTGPARISGTGEYIIPEFIDEKRVVGITGDGSGGGFCNDLVKDHVISVTLPSSAYLIGDGALSECSALCDVFFSSDRMSISENALPPDRAALTIHCPLYSTDGISGEYYATCAERYGARFKDWNGRP